MAVGVFVVIIAMLCAPRTAHAASVTEFSTGITAGSFPQGIAAGPDGNLWFAETSANRIGRITPTGTVTESPKSLRVSSTGRFAYSFSATPRSSGKIKLASVNKVKISSTNRTLTVASRSFTVPANSKVKAKFKLSKRNLKVLKRVKRLRCTVAVTFAGASFKTRLILNAP